MTEVNPRAALREALHGLADAETLGRPGSIQRAHNHVVGAAWELLGWMDENGVDPGDSPSCACGGYHWTCDYGGDRDDDD